MSQWEWEFLPDDFEFQTWRMKVPGGWLIKTTDDASYHAITSTIIFVPEIKE